MFSGPKQVDSQHCWWQKSCMSWRAVYSCIYDRFHTSQVIGQSPEPKKSLQSMCMCGSWTFMYFMFDYKTWTDCHWCHTTRWADLYIKMLAGRVECWFPQHSTKCTNKHEKGTYVWSWAMHLFYPNLGDLGAFMKKQYHTWMVSSFINFSDCVTILTNQLAFRIPLPFGKLT